MRPWCAIQTSLLTMWITLRLTPSRRTPEADGTCHPRHWVTINAGVCVLQDSRNLFVRRVHPLVRCANTLIVNWTYPRCKHPLIKIRCVHTVSRCPEQDRQDNGPCPLPNERLQGSTISATRPNIPLSESEGNICTTLVCLWYSFPCLTLRFYSYKIGDRSPTSLQSFNNFTTTRFAALCW